MLRDPSRTQTRFCCRPGPPVACASTRSRPCSVTWRAASTTRTRPVAITGLRGERAARRVDVHVVAETRARRAGSPPAGENVRRQLGDLDRARRRARRPRPASAVDGETVRSRMPGWWMSMRWSMPRDPRRPLDQRTRPCRRRRGRPRPRRRRSAGGRGGAAAAHVRLGEQLVDVELRRSPARIGLPIALARLRATTSAKSRSVALPGVEQRPRLQRGERPGSRPSGAR